MLTRTIYIKRGSELWDYLDAQSHNAKKLYNRCLFILRNAFTGLRKEEADRHPLEQKTIDLVSASLNGTKYSVPDAGSRLMNYYQLDTVLKNSKDKDYYAMPAQVNQAVVKKACEAFSSYFKACKSYRINPDAFTGRPRMPRYLKKDRYATTYSNQVISISDKDGKSIITFPKSGKLSLCIGDNKISKENFVRTEAVYSNGMYKVLVTYEENQTEIAVPENPKRILGLDFGAQNFVAGAFNFNEKPFVVNGGYVKSVNRLCNKKVADCQSKMSDSKKTSSRIERTTSKRERRLRDFFYKTAHVICRRAKRLDVNVIVAGINPGIKQHINLGHVNDQQYVQIPFLRFAEILTCVAAKYGIPVVIREESYTSKSSFLDMDSIPTFGKDKGPFSFSGRRKKRGLYCTNNGIKINADINAAANIARKEYPNEFSYSKDYSYLYGSVENLK